METPSALAGGEIFFKELWAWWGKSDSIALQAADPSLIPTLHMLPRAGQERSIIAEPEVSLEHRRLWSKTK